MRGNSEVRTHPAAVGSREWPTPTGSWEFHRVDINPEWNPPKSEDWAKDETRKAPGDPENPMGRARLVYRMPNTVHGTDDLDSLGKPVSHGSIRVANEVALELADEFGGSLWVCSAFDVEYHHVVFHNIKDVLSVQASKVFKFEEQEELHNNIIDKGLLKLCQANLKRAQVMASEFPDVEIETQILVGKPFQVVMQWIEEVKPSLLVLARHGSHRIDGTEMGSQAENLVRLATCNTLVIGTENVKPDEIPWIEEDGETGLEWSPDAEVRILRVPPFALGIARKAVEEFCIENYSNGHLPIVTGERLDEAIRRLLPTHMQLIMGIGTAEELALAEVKAEEAMKRTVVKGSEADPASLDDGMVEAKCPYTGHVSLRARTEADPVEWTAEAFEPPSCRGASRCKRLGWPRGRSSRGYGGPACATASAARPLPRARCGSAAAAPRRRCNR